MTAAPATLAFVLGVLLFLVEEVALGYLSATTVPRAYFDWFGTHKVAALVVEEAVLVALPAFLFAFGWGLATMKVVRRPPVRVACWVVGGLVVAWIVRSWQVLAGSALDASSSVRWALVVPPVWGLLTSASVPFGVLGAGLFAQRSLRASIGVAPVR